MDPSSNYNVTDIDNNETANFMTMWQDSIEPQSQPLHFNLPEDILLWDQTTLTNNSLAGSMMPGPADGTNPPVIDLTESTPEHFQSPGGSYLGRPYTNSASYSPSETSHLLHNRGTPSTIAEDNLGSQQSATCLADTTHYLLKYVIPFYPDPMNYSVDELTVPLRSKAPSSRRLYKCEWRDCHTTGEFHRELDLVRHIRTVHISPDKYRCDSCGKAFGRKDHLNGHRKKRHESLRHSAKAENIYSSGS